MSISDKTRKVLWGRSGNRCAICRHELVIDATWEDDESVVGDECHIISASEKGPRHDPTYRHEKLDAFENLILLCRIHHKMVDDQEETYTPEILRRMKANHQLWVSEKLACALHKPKPLRICRIMENVPDFLSRLTSGEQVLDLVRSSCGYSMKNDELKSQDEVDLIGGFFQTISDWGDVGDHLEPAGRVGASYDLTQDLQELEDAGFLVFGGCEIQRLEGGIQPKSSDWPVSIFHVLRSDSNEIIHVDFDEMKQEDFQPEELSDNN